MLKMLALAALLTAPTATPPAPPVAPPCITRQQIGDFTVIGMAMMVETARNACRPHLAESAFLATPAGAEFSARLRTQGRARLDSAMAGFSRMTGSVPGVSAATVRSFAETMLAEGVGADFSRYADPGICRDVNDIFEISATLSPDQMAQFVGAFASIADRIARMAQAGTFPGMTPPETPTPPAAAPTPRPTPASLEFRPRGRAAPATSEAPAPRPPLQPFLCRDGE